MKRPVSPPTLADLLGDIQKGRQSWHRLTEITRAVSGPTVRDRYRHWSRLKFLQPPAGLSHRDWWLGLKLARSFLLRDLPLKDGAGKPFRLAMVDPALELLHRIDSEASGQIAVSSQVIQPQTRDRYVVSSLMEEAITSSQIEGAATTRRVAKDMLRSGRAPRDKSERMIFNNFRTMQSIVERNKEPLTPDLVFEIHGAITEGTLETPESAGRFRRDDEDIAVHHGSDVLHVPPPATQLSSRMKAMCAFANGESAGFFVHPVVRAILLHFWLAHDHPFVDGNGRTARALFYRSMLSQGYWLCEFLPISRVVKTAPSRYARAFLYSETDENDATYFVLYHLGILGRALTDLQAYLKSKMREQMMTEKILSRSATLNHRQIALLTHALKHDDAEFTVASHRNSHNVVYQTARSDLIGLVGLGLLTQRKSGKMFVFHPGGNLEKRLRQLK